MKLQVDKNVTFLFCSNLPKPGLHPHAWPYTTSQPTRSSSQPTPYSSVRTTYSTGRPTRLPWPYPIDRPTDSDSNIDQQLATSYQVIMSVEFLTINVLLFKKLGQFKGSKKSWPPQNVPRNGS